MLKRWEGMRRDTPGARAWAAKKRKAMRRESPKHRARREAWRLTLEAWVCRQLNEGRTPLCQLCADPLPIMGPDIHAHHIELRSKGGKDNPANLAGLHSKCHDWLHDGSMSAVTITAQRRLAAFAAANCNLTNYNCMTNPRRIA